MKYLEIVDWDVHQSYRKDRGVPPWIKVHRSCLTSQRWLHLNDSEKGALVSMWIVASAKEGLIPADPSILKRMCQLDKSPNIKKYIELGYLQPAANQELNPGLSSGCQVVATEEEVEGEGEAEEEVEAEADRQARRLLDKLNNDGAKKWQYTKTNLGYIRARMLTHTIQELEHAINVKVAEWKDDPKMDQYLRPSTIFCLKNCETYINQKLGLKVKTKTMTKLEEISKWGSEDEVVQENIQISDGATINVRTGDR